MTISVVVGLATVRTDVTDIIDSRKNQITIICAGANDMQFNKSKFKLQRYRGNTDLKAESSYYFSNNKLVVEKKQIFRRTIEER